MVASLTMNFIDSLSSDAGFKQDSSHAGHSQAAVIVVVVAVCCCCCCSWSWSWTNWAISVGILCPFLQLCWMLLFPKMKSYPIFIWFLIKDGQTMTLQKLLQPLCQIFDMLLRQLKLHSLCHTKKKTISEFDFWPVMKFLNHFSYYKNRWIVDLLLWRHLGLPLFPMRCDIQDSRHKWSRSKCCWRYFELKRFSVKVHKGNV